MKKEILAIIVLAMTTLTTAAQPPQWNGNHARRSDEQQQGAQQQQKPQVPQQFQQRPQGWQQPQQGQQQGWQQPKFDPAEFQKRIEGYISMKAGLTKEESEKFFPTYREFKDKQRELTLKQQTLKRSKPANDKEYENVLKQIADLGVEIARLEQTYYPKLSKLIPAKKVFLVMQAEDDFHRDLVRQPTQFGAGRQWGGNNRNGFGMPQQQKQQQGGQQKK